jgi:flavin reductase (DIM6/NTAB) family NADH-FMN oxidoreductase RutF
MRELKAYHLEDPSAIIACRLLQISKYQEGILQIREVWGVHADKE